MQTGIYRMNTQQDPTVRHRNCGPYPVINHNGKEYEKECLSLYIYICITESLCCTVEINTTL